MKEFGQALRYYRERAGFSQNQLANRSAYNHSFISRLESGERPVKRLSVQRIALGLGLDAVDTDRLLVSAGFRPTELSSVLHEPMLAELDNLIAISPPSIGEDLRGLVRAAVAAGRAGVAQGLVGV